MDQTLDPLPALPTSSPYAQYWKPQPCADEPTALTKQQWLALTSMRSAYRTGQYASDAMSLHQQRLVFAQRLYQRDGFYEWRERT